MVQVNVTLTETIKKLLEEKKYSTLKDILTTMMPFDIAAVFSRRRPSSRWTRIRRNF